MPLVPEMGPFLFLAEPCLRKQVSEQNQIQVLNNSLFMTGGCTVKISQKVNSCSLVFFSL